MNSIEKRINLVELKTNRKYWQREEDELDCDICNEEPCHKKEIVELKKGKKQITNMIIEIDKLIKKLESKRR